MKILLINPFSKTAAVRQCNLARKLQKRGNEVSLMLPKFDQYSSYQKRRLPKEWGVTPIHPFQFKSKKLELSFLFYIPSAILKSLTKKFHVVHAFRPTPFSGLIGYIIARLKRIPFVLEHGDIEWETMENLKTHPGYRVKIVKWLEKYLTKHADAITVMNTNVFKYVKKNYSPKVSVNLIPNGVDTDYFSPDQPSKRKALAKKLVARSILMYVGKLDNIEHIKDLIKVIPKLHSRYGLVIVGGGSNTQILKDMAKELNIQKRVLFTGMVPHDEIPQYLNAADILLAPFAKTKGVEHASNLKVFEYMAMGKPIVASKVGDLPEVLKGCGILIEPGNISQLAKAIQTVPADLGKKARAKSQEYDWKTLAHKAEDVYDKIQ